MSVSDSDLPSEDSTIFSTLPGQFPDPKENEKIKTQEFLDASAGVVVLVEKLGKVFAPVVYDINGNIRKISAKYEEDRENHKFIEDMILKQKNSGELVVVDALQWLRRALHFISRFFQLIIEDVESQTDTKDLSPFVKHAYRETLERHHDWLGTQLFNILSRFTPNRRYLFYILALNSHDKDELVTKDMKIFTLRMWSCVQRLMDFYQEHDLETDSRV